MKPVIDVLICGAGAAGLTLAIELARRGVAFRLIEQAASPFHGSRGKGIQPRTQEIFEDLGLLDRAVAIGGLYPVRRTYHADGSHTDARITEQRYPTAAEPYHLALMVPQFLTESVMRDRLLELGQRPDYACRLTDFEQHPEGVTAWVTTPQGEDIIRARYLVGTDGGRSFVRGKLGIGFPGRTLGVRAVVADVVLKGLALDAWHQFNEGSEQRMLSLCPLAGTDLFQLQAPVPFEGEVDSSPAGLQALIMERTGRADIEIESVTWASVYAMNARLADRYRIGRTFLAGDAAHVHPPTGGQGLNTSVQDAYNLGWKLAAVLHGAPDTLLDSYEQERRPVAAAMLGLSTRLLQAMKQGDNRRGRDVQQLDLGYPESALSLERPPRPQAPFAGDRAPDAPVLGAAGQPVRLFQLFAGTHWTLLGYKVNRASVAPRPGLRVHVFGPGGDLFDWHGHFEQAYSPEPGDWILVRPDGYIGACVSTANVGAIEHYLDEVLDEPETLAGIKPNDR